MFKLWLYSYQTKARNQGNTVVATNKQKVKHWICCCYCIPGVPSFRLIWFDMHKAIVKTFSFLEVIQVIRGRKRSLEGQTLDLSLLMDSLGSQLSFDMHKAIVKRFSFLEVIQVIRGQQNVKHWIRCCNCIPGIPSFLLICIKPQLKHFHYWRSFWSLEVVEVIRRPNTGSVAATGFPGFLAFV